MYYEVPGLLFLIILCVYFLFQIIPLPSPIIRVISPATYSIIKDTIFVENPAAWGSLSVNKKATLQEFFRFVSYGALYILTVQLLSRRKLLKRAVFIFIIFTSLLSLFGILQHILWNGKIYWFRELKIGGVPFGPYVNRNHYAGFIEMIFPIVIGLFLFYKPRVSYTSFREKLAELFNLQRTNVYILLGFSAVLMGTSLFLSLSRSGIVSLCLSMILFGLLIIVQGHDRKRGYLIVIIFVLIGLSVGWFGWGQIIERFKSIGPFEGDFSDFRPVIWKDSIRMLQDFIVTGTGFGSYVYVYPLYSTLSDKSLLQHAHNDYLELIAEGGLIAFFIITIALLTILYKAHKIFKKRYELYAIYLYIGCVSGIVAMLLHSFTDFNLQIGANGLIFFFLLGLAVTTSHTRFREGLEPTYLKRIKIPSLLSVFVAGMLFISCVLFHAGIIVGKQFFLTAKEKSLNRKLSEFDAVFIKHKLAQASFADLFESKYPFIIANIDRQFADYDKSLKYYQRAIELHYLNGEYLQRLGLLLATMKKYENADRLLQAGIKYSTDRDDNYKRYIVWLLSMKRKQEASKFIQSAISEEPRTTKGYLKLMTFYKFSDYEILGALPERVEPHIIYAEYLAGKGKDTLAYNMFMDSLKYLKSEEKVEASYFYRAYAYYFRRGLFEEALSIMRKAREFLPQEPGIPLRTAMLYERLNIPYRAIEEYKQVLVIDPENREARQRLEKILSKK